MALFKAKALVDGVETEVELDDTKFLTLEQHEVRVQDTVRGRLARHAKDLRQKLLTEEEFVGEVLKAKGIDPDAKPSGKVGPDEVAKLQEQWRTQELKPLQERAEKAEGTLTKTRDRTLRAELERALIAAGVKSSVAGRIAALEAGRFAFDETTEMFALRKGDGFDYSSKATSERPYKGVEEFAKEWAEDKDNADFVQRQSQSGPGLGGMGGQKAGVVQISRADARNHTKFKAAEEEAAKLGGTVQITD